MVIPGVGRMIKIPVYPLYASDIILRKARGGGIVGACYRYHLCKGTDRERRRLGMKLSRNTRKYLHETVMKRRPYKDRFRSNGSPEILRKIIIGR